MQTVPLVGADMRHCASAERPQRRPRDDAMPELIVEAGPVTGQKFAFDRAIVIGRGEHADLRLDDVTVSRRHAELRPVGDGWEIVDLNSANGVVVNEVERKGPFRLGEGDRIGIGNVALRFTLEQRVAERAVVTPMPTESSGSRLFQELLARVRAFCDLGQLARQRHAVEDFGRRALEILLAAFPRADRAALFVRQPIGDSVAQLVQIARDQRAFQPTAIAPLVSLALREARPLVLVDPNERLAQSERLRMPPLYGAVAAIPIEAQGEYLGALYLDATKDNEAIKPADLEHLIALANLIGVQLAALIEPRRDREVQRHDLTLARRIQQRFLPQAPPSLSGYQIVDTYAAARTVGGDHYDFLVLADGRHALVIADVSGKALPGALYMARLGMILREAARRTRRAAELLDDVNAALYRELEAGMFVTMLVVVLEPRTGQIEVAAAGHPLPLLRAVDGSVRVLDVQHGPPLGAMSEPTYVASKHVLEPGQILLMYTDGLDEAQDADGRQFGAERVRASLARADDARSAINTLREDLARFVGSTAQSDDLTLLAVQRLPAPR